jgi:hypothetical protein
LACLSHLLGLILKISAVTNKSQTEVNLAISDGNNENGMTNEKLVDYATAGNPGLALVLPRVVVPIWLLCNLIRAQMWTIFLALKKLRLKDMFQ